MTDSVIQKIAKQGSLAGFTSAHTSKARQWFQSAVKEMGRKATGNDIMTSDKARLKVRIREGAIGGLYLFMYQPKWRKELPYYDAMPLVIPIELYNDGFLGLNLHYLPYGARAQLLNELMKIMNTAKDDSKKRIKVSYELLKTAARYGLYKPCVKRYLYPFCRSRFYQVYASEWPTAIFLPLARFQKQSAPKIWAESMAKV